MSGLRIHHPELRNCVLIIPHPGGNGRKPKDIHITIDNEGDSIVSETVWQHLKEARASALSVHDFILMNTVLYPPTLRIGVNTDERTVDQTHTRIYKQIRDIAQEFAPDGTTPRITQKDN